jgi:hypothetical protein
VKLDYKAIVRSVGWLLVWWVVAILVATLSGYPGAVCVTPLGWIMALSVGQRSVVSSISENPNMRLVEAALGGALLCLLQGFLFALIIAFGSPLGAESGNPYGAVLTALIGFGIVGGGGAVVGAALSLVSAALQMRRIKSQSDEENEDRSDSARRMVN